MKEEESYMYVSLPIDFADLILEDPKRASEIIKEAFICEIVGEDDGWEDEEDDDEILPGKITFHNDCEWDGVMKALNDAGYDVEIHVMERDGN